MPHTLIVGGTRGLGREVVRILASRGSRVSVIGRREPPERDRHIPNVQHWIADLLDGDAALRAAESAVVKNGPLNYLIFCQRYRGKDDDWAGEIQVSLTATKQLIEALTPKFAPEGDRGIVRSEERRVGKEGRTRGVAEHIIKR